MKVEMKWKTEVGDIRTYQINHQTPENSMKTKVAGNIVLYKGKWVVGYNRTCP